MRIRRKISLLFVMLAFGLISQAQIKEFIGDTIELSLKGYLEGKIQWQFSKDNNIWSDIQDGNTETINYVLKNTGIYRAKIQSGSCAYYSDTTLVYATLNSNTDTIPNVIYMYYKDSITLSKVLPSYVTGKYASNNSAFGVKNEKLYLNNPNDLSLVEYNIQVTNQNTNLSYPLKIKIRGWIKDKYMLYPIVTKEIPQFICSIKDTVFTINNGKLYYSIKNQGNKTFCADLPLADPMYNQFISKYGYYAFRTGGMIYVSADLNKWELIYDGKRGIKESMVIVTNKNGAELIFSEYTPGTALVRHYLKCYNFKKKELTERLTFYTAKENADIGLSPYARHIHFLIQDPYSGMIFLSTGDASAESAIYYSIDQGMSFLMLGRGSQYWRSLSMFFNEDYIFWNMDSSTSQYLLKVKKSKIHENMSVKELTKYPLINSALWCSEAITIPEKQMKMIVMSANNEGAFYDNNFRNYGIVVENNEPVVYELFEKKAQGVYSQYYPIGCDYQNNILMLDLETNIPAYYKVIPTH